MIHLALLESRVASSDSSRPASQASSTHPTGYGVESTSYWIIGITISRSTAHSLRRSPRFAPVALPCREARETRRLGRRMPVTIASYQKLKLASFRAVSPSATNFCKSIDNQERFPQLAPTRFEFRKGCKRITSKFSCENPAKSSFSL